MLDIEKICFLITKLSFASFFRIAHF